MAKFEIQLAKLTDIPKVKAMINLESREYKTMQSRSLEELYARIREIYVVRDQGKVIASGALRIHSDNLAEVNCFVIAPEYRGRGLGRRIIKKLLANAKSYGVSRVITGTYIHDFFEKLGFTKSTKEEISQKVQHDCIHCDRYPDECKAEFYIKYL